MRSAPARSPNTRRSGIHEDRDRGAGRPAPQRPGTGRAVVAGLIRTAREVTPDPRICVEASREASELFVARLHRSRSGPAVGATRPDAVDPGAGAGPGA